MSKQLKINELKRVVDLDKFAKYTAILKDPKFNNEKEIDKILKELDKKTPSRDVLLKTRLGFILKDLASRETLPKSIRDQAKQLRIKWKEFHKRLLMAPTYDVKCDKPTTENREKARHALSSAFIRSNSTRVYATASATNSTVDDSTRVSFKLDNEDHSSLVAELEFIIFQSSDKLVNQKYFAKCRQVVKLVTDNLHVRDKFLNGEIDSTELLQNYLEEQSFKRFFSCSSSSLVSASELEMLEKNAEIECIED
jgi:hypothetical protein